MTTPCKPSDREWRGTWRIKLNPAADPAPKPDPLTCTHQWRSVWNDYYSSCNECVLCGKEHYHEY